MCGHVWHTADIHSQKRLSKNGLVGYLKNWVGSRDLYERNKEPLFIDQSMEPSQVNSLLKSLNIPK